MDEGKLRRQIAYCWWVWIVGSVIALLSAIIALSLAGGEIVLVMLGITVVQTVLAIPAALMLPKRKNWARIVLMVLALLCIASLFSALKAGAWPTLVLNLLLGSTYAVLGNRQFKEAYQRPLAA